MAQTSYRGSDQPVRDDAEASVARTTRARTAGVPTAEAPTAGVPTAEAPTAGVATTAAHRAREAARGALVRRPLEVPAMTARFVAASGQRALRAVRHPETVLDRARRLPLTATMLREATMPILTGRVDGWRGEYAYTAGVQAYIYGFPYIYNAQLRHAWVTQPRDPAVIPYAAVNHFWHAARPFDAAYRDGGCPNNDTLYSLAWLDLSDEPVILSHPDMADRYFTFELMGFTSDNFDYIGQRTTGSAAGNFAIVGPDWRGELPAGVRSVERAPTAWVLVLGRTLVDGPLDVPNVRSLQAKYRLTPLSLWGRPRAKVPERRDVYLPADEHADALGQWKTLNAMLAENPPPPHHALMLDQFARIGIGPGLDVEAQPDIVKHGLMRAAMVGASLLRQQFLSGDWATVVNGWRYPPPQAGRYGDDFLQRAADQSLAGIAANDPAEAVYLVNFDDAEGRKLSPAGRYQLRFAADNMPPVDAFWSLTAYTEADMNLIANPANRYSVGDRTMGLRRDPDGGLTIYVQPESPGDDREPNWLPTSANQGWFAVLRLYRPRPEVVEARWECPALRRIG